MTVESRGFRVTAKQAFILCVLMKGINDAPRNFAILISAKFRRNKISACMLNPEPQPSQPSALSPLDLFHWMQLWVSSAIHRLCSENR